MRSVAATVARWRLRGGLGSAARGLLSSEAARGEGGEAVSLAEAARPRHRPTYEPPSMAAPSTLVTSLDGLRDFVSADMLANLEGLYGGAGAELRNVQAQTFFPVLGGELVVCNAPLGAGKTLAYALPLLVRLDVGKRARDDDERPDRLVRGHRPSFHVEATRTAKQVANAEKRGKPRVEPGIRALVVAATPEAARGVVDVARGIAKGTGLVVESVVDEALTANPRRAADQATVEKRRTDRHAVHAALVARGCDLLVATPVALYDVLHHPVFSFALKKVDTFVLDDGDRLLDAGYDQPYLHQILGALPRDRQSLLFQATMPVPLEVIAHSGHFPDKKHHTLIECRNKHLEAEGPIKVKAVFTAPKDDPFDALFGLVAEHHAHHANGGLSKSRKTAVFCQSARHAEFAARYLRERGLGGVKSLTSLSTEKAQQNLMNSLRSGPTTSAAVVCIEAATVPTALGLVSNKDEEGDSDDDDDDNEVEEDSYSAADMAAAAIAAVTAGGQSFFPRCSMHIHLGKPHDDLAGFAARCQFSRYKARSYRTVSENILLVSHAERAETEAMLGQIDPDEHNVTILDHAHVPRAPADAKSSNRALVKLDKRVLVLLEQKEGTLPRPDWRLAGSTKKTTAGVSKKKKNATKDKRVKPATKPQATTHRSSPPGGSDDEGRHSASAVAGRP